MSSFTNGLEGTVAAGFIGSQRSGLDMASYFGGDTTATPSVGVPSGDAASGAAGVVEWAKKNPLLALLAAVVVWRALR